MRERRREHQPSATNDVKKTGEEKREERKIFRGRSTDGKQGKKERRKERNEVSEVKIDR